MDRELVGFWRVLSFEMIEDVAVRLIPFEIGEPVEFTASGKYTMWADPLPGDVPLPQFSEEWSFGPGYLG